ncbi:MAG: RNA polymerase sigma factor [Planctomycetaceae bacterium]
MPVTRDSLILRISRGGDPASWEEFFAIYYPFLHNVVRRWGVDDHDACDIVQDVFVTLLRALPQFEFRPERGRFRGWLKTIVQNIAIDRLRRRGRLREVVIGEEPCAAELPASDDEWDAAYQEQVASFAIQQVRSTSAPATWRCFEEHFLKARPASDVAQEIGLSSGAVYMNASRTLSRIRAKCADYDADLVGAPRSLGRHVTPESAV